MSNPQTPLVEFRDVSKRFGDFVAVRSINLDIARGEFVAIMGPSGCGKTTTLRMIAGLEEPSEGQILLDGKVMNKVPPNERDTPLVWQSLALFPFLNARENVEFGLKMRGVDAPDRKKRALDWLERLDMGEFADRPVDQLSGGQRQRVALARALVTEPPILLLDEPLSALDAHLVIRMQSVLTRLQRDLNITFVYVTHSQSEAFAMANRVVIMGNGNIEQVGTARQIYRSPRNRFVAGFVGRNNILEGEVTATAADSIMVNTQSGRFTVSASDNKAAIGDKVAFSVAADLVGTGDKASAMPNIVNCQIISEEFVGSMVTLFVESPDGTEFKAQMPERELEQRSLAAGQPIRIGWASTSAHLLED